MENIIAIYEYQCTGCEVVFTRILSMKDNKLPESEPCPECGEHKVLQYHAGMGTVKLLGDVNKFRNQDFKNHMDNLKSKTAKYFKPEVSTE